MKLLFVLLLVFAAVFARDHESYLKMIELQSNRQGISKAEDHITQPLKYVENLPENWRWDNVNATNFLTIVKNQHVPQYCGSCWAQASASSISDRIKIMRKGAWPDINIAPQVFVSCSEMDRGCGGGFPVNAFKYAHDEFLTDETCAIYRGRDTKKWTWMFSSYQMQKLQSS